MKIEKIILRKVKMDLQFVFQTSFGRETDREFIITEVHGDGHSGYGECVVSAKPFYTEETVSTAWHIMEDFLIPLLFAQANIDHPAAIQARFGRVRRHHMAKAALEGAVWDLYAKQQQQSLAGVLGGHKKEIAAGVSIGIQPTQADLLRLVEKHLKQGFQKFKLKIEPGQDLHMLEAVRKEFGAIPLMADANSAYTLDDISLFKEMDDLDLLMFEQPLAHDDFVDHARLQQEIRTPICLDESIHSFDDARQALELGSAQIINIKIGRVGGLSEAMKIHDLCQERHIPVWCGGMLESGIGRAHNIALSSLDHFTIPGDIAPSARYWREDIIEPEVMMNERGRIEVPQEPGIGYRVNEKALSNVTLEQKVYVPESGF